jgi:hypothetical protein
MGVLLDENRCLSIARCWYIFAYQQQTIGNSMKFIDLTGQKFGRLIVQRSILGGKRIMWECLCSCGNITQTSGPRLKKNETRSCGCLQKEQQSIRIASLNTIHGHNKKGFQSLTHKSWTSMLHRCRCSTYTAFKYYGGRGIKVCKRWNEFKNFLEDMGERPSKNHSIDRIDVDGDYEPANCRWATRSQQQRNKQCHKK